MDRNYRHTITDEKRQAGGVFYIKLSVQPEKPIEQEIDEVVSVQQDERKEDLSEATSVSEGSSTDEEEKSIELSLSLLEVKTEEELIALACEEDPILAEDLFNKIIVENDKKLGRESKKSQDKEEKQTNNDSSKPTKKKKRNSFSKLLKKMKTPSGNKSEKPIKAEKDNNIFLERRRGQKQKSFRRTNRIVGPPKGAVLPDDNFSELINDSMSQQRNNDNVVPLYNEDKLSQTSESSIPDKLQESEKALQDAEAKRKLDEDNTKVEEATTKKTRTSGEEEEPEVKKEEDPKIQEKSQQDQLYSSFMKMFDPTYGLTDDEMAVVAEEYRDEQNQLYSSALKIIDPGYYTREM